MLNNRLHENTKVATYFLWEYTGYENAMDLWYCTEDIAYNFFINDIKTSEGIFEIIQKGKKSFEYIFLVRHIAFRIYIYTNNIDSMSNWYIAERLLLNREWCESIINITAEFAMSKGDPDILNGMKLDRIKHILQAE